MARRLLYLASWFTLTLEFSANTSSEQFGAAEGVSVLFYDFAAEGVCVLFYDFALENSAPSWFHSV
jgi:hypothetical protein